MKLVALTVPQGSSLGLLNFYVRIATARQLSNIDFLSYALRVLRTWSRPTVTAPLTPALVAKTPNTLWAIFNAHCPMWILVPFSKLDREHLASISRFSSTSYRESGFMGIYLLALQTSHPRLLESLGSPAALSSGLCPRSIELTGSPFPLHGTIGAQDCDITRWKLA